jgi:arylsulfatase A-like enzyme
MNPRTDRRSFLQLLSLLPLTPLLGHCSPAAKEGNEVSHIREAPNVLILVFDALSAGHVSLYGYHRNTTPNLARFAERSTVFHRHYAAGNFTTPGTASILTGTYPWSHRACHLLGTVAEGYERQNLFSLFASEGYRTVAYTHNLLVSVLLHQFREGLTVLKKMRDLGLMGPHISEGIFLRDFDVAAQSEWLFHIKGKSGIPPSPLFLSLLEKVQTHFLQEATLPEEYRSLFPRGLQTSIAPPPVGLYFILEDAIDWIQAELSSTSQPFVGYYHLMPPHEPYHPRREFIGLFDDNWHPVAKPVHFFSEGHSEEYLDQQRREYDEHIAYTDAEFGRLYDFLIESNLLSNTYVVVTSDHGEMFERGIHAHWTETLYDPIVHVPLLISRPGLQQRVDVDAPTSNVDLLPTLLHATGHSIPDLCEGQLLPTFDNDRTTSQQDIFSVEAKSNPKHAPLAIGTVALIKDRYKLIHYFGYSGYESEFELYDLGNDPEEVEDVYHSKGSVAIDLQDELLRKLHEVNSQTSSSG